jgi:hypothetical protein
MAKFRYTIKDLEEFSDYKMLSCIVLDRQDTCTNVYSPLYKRLQELYNKLRNNKPLTK